MKWDLFKLTVTFVFGVCLLYSCASAPQPVVGQASSHPQTVERLQKCKNGCLGNSDPKLCEQRCENENRDSIFVGLQGKTGC